MTIALAAPPAAAVEQVQQTESTPAPASWFAVSDGLWSCNRDGNFLGSVEFTGGRFEAVDGTGNRLGRSHSLAGAKKLIEGLPPEQYSEVLRWRDDRRAFAWAWGSLFVSAAAAVVLGVQMLV